MKIKHTLGLFLLIFVHHNTQVSVSDIILKKYKQFLINGTYQGQNWSSFTNIPKSRYHTFKSAFNHFINYDGKVVVELGTSRSFVHGGLVGCNSSDISYWTPKNPQNWDWGAGFFTRIAAECLESYAPEMHTVDICSEHIQRCKIITADFSRILHYHVMSSVDFLKNCVPESIDLLYIDTGDMTPIEPTAILQLEEAKVIVEKNLISKNGIIVIDDVKNQTPKEYGDTSEFGKAKYSLAYFLKHGFVIVEDEYQVILRKE